MLGTHVKDKITGFSGVVTGYVEYLTGCNQALVVPGCGPDGALRSAEWFDIQRLERMDDTVIVLDNGNNPGCDKAAPKR